MVTVVSKEPDRSVIKEVICRQCGATLNYTPIEVKEDYTSDYLGDKDYYNYITCPNCSSEVRVRK